MSTLRQLRDGLNETWDTVVDGWQRFYRRAASAITRFAPAKRKDGVPIRALAGRSAGWGVLAAEVSEDDKRIVVRLEAPGMEKADFDLEVLDGHLIIRGEKRVEEERTEGRYHISECAYGSFERAIPLPDEVDADGGRATYRNGILRVELPRLRAQRRKSVIIQ